MTVSSVSSQHIYWDGFSYLSYILIRTCLDSVRLFGLFPNWLFVKCLVLPSGLFPSGVVLGLYPHTGSYKSYFSWLSWQNLWLYTFHSPARVLVFYPHTGSCKSYFPALQQFVVCYKPYFGFPCGFVIYSIPTRSCWSSTPYSVDINPNFVVNPTIFWPSAYKPAVVSPIFAVFLQTSSHKPCSLLAELTLLFIPTDDNSLFADIFI